MRYLFLCLFLVGCSQPIGGTVPDPWPCLRIGSQMSGKTDQLVAAVDSSDQTEIESVSDRLDLLSTEYVDCVQAYIQAENQVPN